MCTAKYLPHWSMTGEPLLPGPRLPLYAATPSGSPLGERSTTTSSSRNRPRGWPTIRASDGVALAHSTSAYIPRVEDGA